MPRNIPDVTVTLGLTNRRVNLIEDNFDLALRVGRNEDSNLISQTLGTFPMHLYASPDYIAAHGSPEMPEDLSAHACLSMSEAENIRHWALSSGGETFVADLSPRLIVNDFLSLRALATDGMGIGLFPDYAVHDHFATGRLSPVLVAWSGPRSALSAVYPSRRGATPKVRAFIDAVRLVIATKVPA